MTFMKLAHIGSHNIYIRTVSDAFWIFLSFKRPINQFKPVQQSWQQAQIAYFLIYSRTVNDILVFYAIKRVHINQSIHERVIFPKMSLTVQTALYIVQCWSYGGLSKDEKKIPKSTKQGRKNRLLDRVLIAYLRVTNTSVTSDVNLRLAELSVNTVKLPVLMCVYNMEINFSPKGHSKSKLFNFIAL